MTREELQEIKVKFETYMETYQTALANYRNSCQHQKLVGFSEHHAYRNGNSFAGPIGIRCEDCGDSYYAPDGSDSGHPFASREFREIGRTAYYNYTWVP